MAPFVQAPALCKQEGFAFEREIRLLIWRTKQKDVPSPQPGIAVPVDASKLINRIVVGTFQDPWFFEMVKSAVESILPGTEVRRSTFDLRP